MASGPEDEQEDKANVLQERGQQEKVTLLPFTRIYFTQPKRQRRAGMGTLHAEERLQERAGWHAEKGAAEEDSTSKRPDLWALRAITQTLFFHMLFKTGQPFVHRFLLHKQKQNILEKS